MYYFWNRDLSPNDSLLRSITAGDDEYNYTRSPHNDKQRYLRKIKQQCITLTYPRIDYTEPMRDWFNFCAIRIALVSSNAKQKPTRVDECTRRQIDTELEMLDGFKSFEFYCTTQIKMQKTNANDTKNIDNDEHSPTWRATNNGRTTDKTASNI